MKISRAKNKASLYLGLGILMFCMLCIPASAGYSYEGYPLETIKNGTGEVYISYGDNVGRQGTSYAGTNFLTNFTSVPTSNVEWAELKVGVWGGSLSRVGWAEIKLDDYLLSNETLQANSLYLSNNVSCCGSGVYLIHCNCTDLIQQTNINNDGVIKATVNTTPGSPALDGRVYGAVLIIAYDDGSYSEYWINQGNLNLHKNVTSGGIYYPDLDANITWFNGTINDTLDDATLTVGYLCGDINQTDYLYFNVPPGIDSPYDLNNPDWDLDDLETMDYLLGTDVANSMSDTATNFDLKSFNVNVNYNNNNYAIFWRGHSDSGEIYDPPWPGVNDQTESYISPFLAVLQIK